MSTPSEFNTVSPSGSDAHWKIPAGVGVVLILSASQNERAHASIFNHANGTLHLKFGASASMAIGGGGGIFNVKLTSGSYYELPKPTWQGEVYGAWDVAGGFAMVLETGDND